MPPESPMSTSVKPFLRDVVAGAEHERLVHLVHRVEQRLDARRDARGRRAARSLTATSGSGGARARPRGSSSAAAERRAHVEVDDEQVLGELLRARDEVTALVEHHRRAVEDELVLAADEVHVDDRDRRVGGARREHRLALAEPARVVRRRVDVDDELGAAGGLGEDRAGRAPRVLADRDADPHAADRRTAGRRPADGSK